MKHLLLLLFLAFNINPIFAQQLLHCGADEMRISTLQQNPKIVAAVIQRDIQLEAFTANFAKQKNNRGGTSIYTIPVVFHVIHKNGNENISREQILNGLTVLNNTFRKTAADTADIIDAFKPIHADCEIEFRLATKDPEGNCHSGINRIASTLTSVGDHQVKELVHWNPSMYLNIYIVANAAGLAGHCVWPADADTISAWDGIVIAHNYVGNIGTSSITRSVVLAHECGHYLNLHHTWGGNNVPEFYYLPVAQASNCSEDDLVSDTPNTIGWTSCNLNASSCGNAVDNVQNAMSYSYCNIMFTQGQKTRMRATLNSSVANRNNLWINDNLIAAGVLPEPVPLCAANFISNVTAVCPHIDNEITFTNTSYHGEIDSVLWTFIEGNPAVSEMEEPTVTYSTPGTHAVTLKVFFNGSSVQITKENYITVLQDSSWSYPFSESFETQPSLDGMQWFSNSFDADNNWQLTNLAAHSGTWSVMVDNYDNARLTVDQLYGPPLDLSNTSQMKIAFKYAFAGQDEISSSTKLQVQVTRNCENSWSTRLTISGDDLETAMSQNSPFVPTSANEWQQAVVNLPSSLLEDGFRFRFVFTSAGRNRIYIDDVNVDITAGIKNINFIISSVLLLPNPVSNRLSVQFTLAASSLVKLSVLNLSGKNLFETNKKRYAIGKHSQELSVENLSEGLYLLRLETENGLLTQRFVVQYTRTK